MQRSLPPLEQLSDIHSHKGWSFANHFPRRGARLWRWPYRHQLPHLANSAGFFTTIISIVPSTRTTTSWTSATAALSISPRSNRPRHTKWVKPVNLLIIYPNKFSSCDAPILRAKSVSCGGWIRLHSADNTQSCHFEEFSNFLLCLENIFEPLHKEKNSPKTCFQPHLTAMTKGKLSDQTRPSEIIFFQFKKIK